jgi:hypothetical protein
MPASHKEKKVIQRRDATGHLDPKYAADLRARSLASASHDADVAFLARARSLDPLAEALGEEFIEAATTGEDAGDALNQNVPEELGGPFVVTKARTESAQGFDRSNPEGATREPFPTVSFEKETRD